MATGALRNRQFGPFLVQARIGSGGMANVYKAIDERSGETVALKVIQATWAENSDIVARFRKEAEIVKALEHPCIVPVRDYGVINSRAYIAMRFMERGSLARRFETPAVISSQEVVRLLRRVASGMDHAHRRGVVHRDLKLENILLDDRGEAALSDFGIARVIGDHSMTSTGDIIGTPLYMSPEQALGRRHIDYRADLYSLAIVVYLLTVGRFPFGGDNVLAILNQHVHAQPPQPSRVNPELPRSLDDVLFRALAKRPEERYPNADAFIEAYARALSDERPRMTTIDLSSAHPITSSLQVMEELPVEAPSSQMTPGQLVKKANETASLEDAVNYLKQALAIDPWYAAADRLLLRLQRDGAAALPSRIAAQKADAAGAGPTAHAVSKPKSPAATIVLPPLPDSEPASKPGMSAPLPKLERNIRSSDFKRAKARRRVVRSVALIVLFFVMITCVLFGVLPGAIGTISRLVGQQPVEAPGGQPIETLLPDVVAQLPPTWAVQLRGERIGVIDHGYLHEYRFDAQRFQEYSGHVRFFSVSAPNIRRRIALIRPDGSDGWRQCRVQNRQNLIDGASEIQFRCYIDQTGTWRLRVFGIRAQSVGLYFARIALVAEP